MALSLGNLYEFCDTVDCFVEKKDLEYVPSSQTLGLGSEFWDQGLFSVHEIWTLALRPGSRQGRQL